MARYGPGPGHKDVDDDRENATPGVSNDADEDDEHELSGSSSGAHSSSRDEDESSGKKKRIRNESVKLRKQPKKSKKESAPKKERRDKRAAVGPPKDHPFGDLNAFGPPPKNPASSFMQFSRKFRAGKERGKAPNAKTVSEAWNVMTEEQRQPFVDMADKDKARVQKQIDEYIDQYPKLNSLEDYKLLVSVLRDKDKRERDGKVARRNHRDSSTHGSSE